MSNLKIALKESKSIIVEEGSIVSKTITGTEPIIYHHMIVLCTSFERKRFNPKYFRTFRASRGAR